MGSVSNRSGWLYELLTELIMSNKWDDVGDDEGVAYDTNLQILLYDD